MAAATQSYLETKLAEIFAPLEAKVLGMVDNAMEAYCERQRQASFGVAWPFVTEYLANPQLRRGGMALSAWCESRLRDEHMIGGIEFGVARPSNALAIYSPTIAAAVAELETEIGAVGV